MSSSDEDDLDLILLDLAVKPKQVLGPRLHLEDLTDVDCERMFRYSLTGYICVISLYGY